MSEKKDQKKQVKKQMHTRLCNIASNALEIAKNYECPEACGFCCKCNTITFTKKEYYGILSRVDPEIKKIIRENTRKTKPVIDAPNYTSVTITDEPELREFTDIVCPLLTKDNKCSIYENRPTICKAYPFILDRIFEENLVPVAPCDVGIEIGLDFVYYFLEGVVNGYKGSVFDIEKYCNISKNIIQHAINAYRDKIDPKIIIKNHTSNAFLIPRPDEMLPGFKEYVIKTPEETRRVRRQAINTFIVQHLENQIDKQETFDFVNHLFE